MDDLLQALLLPEPQARQAWERWRAGTNVHSLSYACQQLFPALNPALPKWLEHDSAAGIFQGIVRLVWSQNQLRLRAAVELEVLLKQSGVRPAAVGPLAWSLRTPPPAIRVIPHLTLLVPRADVRKAADVLARAGWERHGDLPSDESSDWYDHVCFHQETLHLNLHWRLIPSPPEDALECERAILGRLSAVRWNHQVLGTISPEASMLHMLCGQRPGDLPWQADVALAGTSGLHWPKFLKLARRFGPLAIERLRELQQYSRLAIPPLSADDPAPLRRKIQYFWSAYRTQSYYQKEGMSWPGFAGFLAQRWNLRHVWLVPFACARRVLQLRRSLLR